MKQKKRLFTNRRKKASEKHQAEPRWAQPKKKHQLQFYERVIIESEVWATVNCMLFLLQNGIFHCSVWQKKLYDAPHWNAD